MSNLNFVIPAELKSKGIKKIEYMNDGIESLSIFYKNEKPWTIPVSPNFDETARLIDTFVNGELDPDTKEGLKQCIKDNLSNIGSHQYKVSQESNYEEWSAQLKQKRKNLEDVVKNNIPHLWHSVQLITSVKCVLNIADCTLPLIVILLGAASSLKTVPIEMLRKSENTFYSDNFSPKAFVSHSTAVSKDKLPDIDMLPKIRYKLFLAPELSPLFTKKDDELIEILGILTSIADGRGYESDTGAHGHRSYVGDYMFTMVGAAIDIPYKVHKYLGALGPKLYFFRLPKLIRDDDDYFRQLKDKPFSVKFNEIQKALEDYLHFLETCPKMYIDNVNKLHKIKWDSEKDEDDALRIIIKIGRLLAHLRAVLPTWDTSGGQGTDYAHATAIKEEPDRAMEQLRNIARGFALSKGRNYITKEDISLPVKVVLSTASIDRVNIFDLLLAWKGTLTTRLITSCLNMAPPTARKIMTELKAVGLVEEEISSNKTEEKMIKLKDEFEWFLSDEFSKLREGFIPTDNSEEMKGEEEYTDDDNNAGAGADPLSLKGKCPPTTFEESDNTMLGGKIPFKLNDDIPKEKCPQCDYWDKPYYLKVHLENEHGIFNDLDMR